MSIFRCRQGCKTYVVNTYRPYSQRTYSALCIRPCNSGDSITEESEMLRDITDSAVEAIILVVDGDDNVVEERMGVRMEF